MSKKDAFKLPPKNADDFISENRNYIKSVEDVRTSKFHNDYRDGANADFLESAERRVKERYESYGVPIPKGEDEVYKTTQKEDWVGTFFK